MGHPDGRKGLLTGFDNLTPLMGNTWAGAAAVGLAGPLEQGQGLLPCPAMGKGQRGLLRRGAVVGVEGLLQPLGHEPCGSHKSK